MQKLIQLKNNKGFTLIEMLIVILIIVILLAIAVPSVIAYREDSQRTADLGAAKTVYTALEASLTTFGELPGPDSAPHSWYKELVAGSNIITYHDIGDGAKVLSTRETPSGYQYAGVVNAQLGSEFFGNYRFGYDTTTNSIAWVSYHHDDHTEDPSSGQYRADDSNVMLYHVADDVSGYLDELPEPYKSDSIYKHDW